VNGVENQIRPAGAEAFDFLIGSWRVRHRKLKDRLIGRDEWFGFDGTMSADHILAGLGNFDQNVIDLPEGRYHACTLRVFHTDQSQWSIHWIDGRDPKLDAPMHGKFADGRGVFFGDDTFEGRPIRIRFLWSDITQTSARWEQAFSEDGGATWETNWVMQFERV
jgi:hypothetical protein